MDGGAWHDSGYTKTDLSSGTHTISYKSISGYNAPSNASISISAGQTTSHSALYDPRVGDLKVDIGPDDAVAGGGKWTVLEMPNMGWADSGEQIGGFFEGTYTVTYSGVSGWEKPTDTTVDIKDGEVTVVSAPYKQISTGSLRVSLSPNDAVDSGAQWSVDGEGWHDSGYTVTGLAAGTHTISYKSTTGYNAPSNTSISILAGQTTSHTGLYDPRRGDIEVNIEPSDAVAAGAQWTVLELPDMGWQSSGDAIGFSEGSYTVTYRDVPGWVKPKDTTVDVVDGEISVVSAPYQNNPELSRAYWWESSQGNNEFDEGETATAAVELAGVAPGTLVTFDVYEVDPKFGVTLLNCDGDYLDTLEGTVGGPEATGYSYATVDWISNTYDGIFENNHFSEYPEVNEVCFVANVEGLKDSSGYIQIIPEQHEMEFIVKYIDGVGRLSVGVYDKAAMNLLPDIPITVSVNGSSYNVQTNTEGTIWKGIFDLISPDGYYQEPGYASIENLNLNLPEQVTVSFDGNDKFLPVTKKVVVQRNKKLNIGKTLKLKIGSDLYTISNLEIGSDATIKNWNVQDSYGTCVNDTNRLAEIAIYIENLALNKMHYNKENYLPNLLINKKAVDIFNDSSKSMAITGSIVGALVPAGALYKSGVKYADIVADKGVGKITKEVAKELAGTISATDIMDPSFTGLSVLSDYEISQRSQTMALSLYVAGDTTGDLKNKLLQGLSQKLASQQEINADEVTQLMRISQATQKWHTKSSEISSYVRNVTDSQFNWFDVWFDWAMNVIPLGSTMQGIYKSITPNSFGEHMTNLLALGANDLVWSEVDQEVESYFSAQSISEKLVELESAGLLGTCSPSKHSVVAETGAGGTVDISRQTVSTGATASFAVTAYSGYSRSTSVGGTCSKGAWVDNVYTTGAISTDCSVFFSFTQNPPSQFDVTASAGDGGNVTPPSQSVDSGSSAIFSVDPQAGFVRSDAVGGTCPTGSWSGDKYETGPVISSCSVSFSFNQNISKPLINPIQPQSVLEGQPYTGPTPELSQHTEVPNWSLLSGPSGMTIDSASGVVSWSSAVIDGSPYTITIAATNSTGTGEASWQLVVNSIEDTDSDGDGVLDPDDQCANTPVEEVVDASGCSPSQIDSDNDGIFDNIDQCPGTPSETQVDEKGCPVSSGTTTLFHETFETYPLGSPSQGWVFHSSWGDSGQIQVVNEVFSVGEKSIKIKGNPGLCQGIYYPGSIQTQDVTFSTDFYLPGGDSEGQFPATIHYAGMRIYFQAEADGFYRAYVGSEGTSVITGLSPQVWHSLEMLVDRDNKKAELIIDSISGGVFDVTLDESGGWGSDISMYGNNSSVTNTVYVDEILLEAADHNLLQPPTGDWWPDELIIKLDVNFSSPDWGTYPMVRFYPNTPFEILDQTNNPYSLQIFNAYMDYHPNEIGIFDQGGANKYYSPPIQSGVWYTVTIEHSTINQVADILIEEHGTAAPEVFYTQTGVPLRIDPFNYIGVGYYGKSDYGSDWSPIRLDNVLITDGSGEVMYEENFGSDPGFTSFSPSYAYWDDVQGNYFVNTYDNLSAKYWAYSPEIVRTISIPDLPALGDANNSGAVDVADALATLQMALGNEPANLDICDVAPLVDGVPSPDGKIDVADALAILRRAVGLLSW